MLIRATIRLVEDITAFNKDYSDDLKLKNKVDGKVFYKIEKSLNGFQETLTKFDLTSQSLFS